MKKVGLMMVVFGNASQGFTQIIRDRAESLAEHDGLGFIVVGINDMRPGSRYAPASFTDLQTGEPAFTHIRLALTERINVVTPNKGPFALDLHELKSLAQKHPAHIGRVSVQAGEELKQFLGR